MTLGKLLLWGIFEHKIVIKNNLLEYVIRASKDVVSIDAVVVVVVVARGGGCALFCAHCETRFVRSRDTKDEQKSGI